jgi:SAM-dependent methyltransferase
MNSSLSFDQAANFYDETRALFDATVGPGIQSLLDATGAGARILEVGTGTGRISIPLLERGVDLIGCDLSLKMLARQREKSSTARLLQADAVSLPFPSDHFDAVLVVHVMHLIGPWRDALREFKRVLRLGGVFLNVSTAESVGNTVLGQMREHWRAWVKEHGIDTRHPGAQSGEEVHAELQSLGAHLQQVEVMRFPHVYTLRSELARYEGRVFSNTWLVPEALHQASVVELREWVMREFGDLDQTIEETSRFIFDIAHFDAR